MPKITTSEGFQSQSATTPSYTDTTYTSTADTYTEPSSDRSDLQTVEDNTLSTPRPARRATPTIQDQTVPLVIFVGPPASGKSMILVRLAKYLRNQGYGISTDPTFLNTDEYQRDCAEFNNKLNTVEALDGTVKFLLVDVYHNNTLIAKLLEAPGEDFYTTDPQKIKAGYNSRVEPYLATIMTSQNQKTYVTLLDLDSVISFRNDQYHRDSYMQRFINFFLPAINLKRDRIVLLYNKIDKTHFGSINGCHDIKNARKDAEIYYKPLFSRLKGGLFNLDLFAFKTFCTGMFSKNIDNNGKEFQTYNVADDIYPQELWKEITRRW